MPSCKASTSSSARVSPRCQLPANASVNARPSTGTAAGRSRRANVIGAAYMKTGNTSSAANENADSARGIQSGPWLG